MSHESRICHLEDRILLLTQAVDHLAQANEIMIDDTDKLRNLFIGLKTILVEIQDFLGMPTAPLLKLVDAQNKRDY